MSNDFPKYWNDEADNITEVETFDNTSQLIPIEETKPLPTIAEQTKIVAESDISEENKGLLQGLVEINNVAKTLEAIRSEETQEQRRTVLTAFCESFVGARLKNNLVAEELKRKLLNRLLDNIDNLDLELTSRIYVDLQETMAVDLQQANAQIIGQQGAPISNPGGINLTINNATSEGATITNNTLNANPQQVGQLKEVAAMNTSIKAWSNIPLPKKNTIDTEFIEKK